MGTRGWCLGLAVACLAGCLGSVIPQQADPGTDGGSPGVDGGGASGIDPAAQHCVDVINMYRSQAGVAAIEYDAKLSSFSTNASQALAAGGGAHQYFIDASNAGSIWNDGFCGGAAENQAPGWSIQPDENGAIDGILAAMMGEGPGGGHHDNIVGAKNALLGVGLVITNGGLWFTNDFSPACH